MDGLRGAFTVGASEKRKHTTKQRRQASLQDARDAPKVEYTLPVRRMTTIVDKLEANRVVFLSGHTGCGKSSQVLTPLSSLK